MSAQWQEFCNTLQETGNELLLAAPDDQTRAEGVAYLARLAAYGIERHMMGSDRLTNGLTFSAPRIGGYNPDYRIGAANLQSGRRYRIRGRMNEAYRIGLGVYSLAPDGGLLLDDYKVLMAGSPGLGHDGDFDEQIGPDMASEKGLHTCPTTNLFLVREILLKQGGKRAELAFDTDEQSANHDLLSVERMGQGMAAVQHFFNGSMKQFLSWTNHFASLPNIMEPLLPEFDNKLNGDPGTVYYTGYFNLHEDQALVIEVPDMTCDYWGVMLANHWQEPLPASFLNHVTAKKDDDGVARIMITSRDPGPGGANWLSTGGRSRGVIWHRTINANIRQTPRCTLRG